MRHRSNHSSLSSYYRIRILDALVLNSIDEAHLQRASHTETWAATYGKGLFGSILWVNAGVNPRTHVVTVP